MLRDLLLRARGLAQHVAAANARAEVRARMYAQLVDMMSRIVAYNRLCDGLLKNATCAGNPPSKTQRMEGKISIVQSIQLDFSHSLGSSTSNEAI